jgi:hypothetical protein
LTQQKQKNKSILRGKQRILSLNQKFSYPIDVPVPFYSGFTWGVGNPNSLLPLFKKLHAFLVWLNKNQQILGVPLITIS